jgi:hypothetical protein
MGVDGVLRDAQTPGDLLGAEMLIHQPQAFPLARRQYTEQLIRPFVQLTHRMKISCISTHLSILCCNASPSSLRAPTD